MKKVSILGSTGSVGRQTLEIIDNFPQDFQIIGLAAGNNVRLLKDQIIKFKPQAVSINNPNAKKEIESFLKSNNQKAEVVCSNEGLKIIASLPDNDILVVATEGTVSILPTFQAIKNGTTIALACKEVLVSAGKTIMESAQKYGAKILPVDSEHAAIKQCLSGIGENTKLVNSIILTASGGPFWTTGKEDFSKITVRKALAHPKWNMGPKISIDSATFMNKGLEVIEAHHLFNIDFDRIKVIVHPQSIVHSIVEFKDGTQLAQLSAPDMRFPIQYALTYPDKVDNPWPKLDLSNLKELQFFNPDPKRFPLLDLAYDIGKKGGTYPVVMNASNEAIVNLFLNEKISFTEIPDLVEKYIASFSHFADPTIDEIIAIDSNIKEKIYNDYK
ncbi:1-deoxy-D-xylulose-5-phosphate reductoisomerase [Candidatus Margulisiibacteriota bacterium]